MENNILNIAKQWLLGIAILITVIFKFNAWILVIVLFVIKYIQDYQMKKSSDTSLVSIDIPLGARIIYYSFYTLLSLFFIYKIYQLHYF